MPVAGILCLGFVIGIMMGFFLVKTKKLTLSALAGAIPLLSGVGALALFRLIDPTSAAPSHAYWYYPLGLAFGIVLAINRLFASDEEPQADEPPSNSRSHYPRTP